MMRPALGPPARSSSTATVAQIGLVPDVQVFRLPELATCAGLKTLIAALSLSDTTAKDPTEEIADLPSRSLENSSAPAFFSPVDDKNSALSARTTIKSPVASFQANPSGIH